MAFMSLAKVAELLDQFGLAGTDFVNQLHRELYSADFLEERSKLALTNGWLKSTTVWSKAVVSNPTGADRSNRPAFACLIHFQFS